MPVVVLAEKTQRGGKDGENRTNGPSRAGISTILQHHPSIGPEAEYGAIKNQARGICVGI